MQYYGYCTSANELHASAIYIYATCFYSLSGLKALEILQYSQLHRVVVNLTKIVALWVSSMQQYVILTEQNNDLRVYWQCEMSVNVAVTNRNRRLNRIEIAVANRNRKLS